ncbi:hypothetical protein EVU91_01330 [Macrococcoides bohemicum]|uniref:hypothetical protein n=1 Tax=Macrococcoides bohemicum TaxID=1903056 RepID=UPI001059CC31|nr:hypothetical protein [Macrococcus bohemicus]TDL40560.1 hypothetical protein EVU91_01330 [Macrococcus bohemicus]
MKVYLVEYRGECDRELMYLGIFSNLSIVTKELKALGVKLRKESQWSNWELTDGHEMYFVTEHDVDKKTYEDVDPIIFGGGDI